MNKNSKGQFIKGHKLGKRFEKGQTPGMKGKHHTKITKIKISNTKKKNPIRYWLGKKRVNMIGDKNPAK